MAEGLKPLRGRSAEMAESVLRTARALSVSPEDLELLAGALHRALALRQDRVEDPHDPCFLHPARTALVLLRDAGVRAGDVLAAGVLLETRRPELALSMAELGAELGAEFPERVVEMVRTAPRPGDSDLAEALVTREEGARTASLAEHLDQLRHLHVELPEAIWPPDAPRRWEEARAVWLPVAERTDAVLARRYRHWTRVFGRRLGRASEDVETESREGSG